MFCLDHFSLHRMIKMLNFKVNDPLKLWPAGIEIMPVGIQIMPTYEYIRINID